MLRVLTYRCGERGIFFSDQDAIIRLYQGYFSKTELKAAVGQFAYSTTTSFIVSIICTIVTSNDTLLQ